MCSKSFLSPEVSFLLVRSRQLALDDIQGNEKPLIDENFCIDWSVVKDILGNVPDSIPALPESWFNDRSIKFWKSAVVSPTDCINESCCKSAEKLFNQPIYLSILKELKLSSIQCSSAIVLHLLLCSSMLDRTLGDIYSLKSDNIPFLLRDLLASDDLKDLVGTTCTEFMQLLFGCVKGFNIRNILWHGFVSDKDLHVELLAVFISLIPSLASCLPVEV